MWHICKLQPSLLAWSLLENQMQIFYFILFFSSCENYGLVYVCVCGGDFDNISKTDVRVDKTIPQSIYTTQSGGNLMMARLRSQISEYSRPSKRVPGSFKKCEDLPSKFTVANNYRSFGFVLAYNENQQQ